jgi:hypothetical protein
MQFLASWPWLTSLRLCSPLPSIYLWITKFFILLFPGIKVHGVFLCSSVSFSIPNYEYVLCLQLDILDIRNVVLSFWTFHHEFWNFIDFMSFLNCQYRNWIFKKSWRIQNVNVLCWDLDLNILTNKGTIIFLSFYLGKVLLTKGWLQNTETSATITCFFL